MFIHGARAVLLRVKYDTGGFGQWVHQMEARAPRNKVIVASRWDSVASGRCCYPGADYRATAAVAAA